ncbi:bifunctional 3'-5' exonuclease/DNA polymerase [Mycetocola tolaasinivorans]|uniref:DNA-directed DNA polymerase n=1 Tax=Mycetocola tolaasinivorans TaxID=76635 RepID=A0A3L7A868_9MICO|nr:bifunctional 3'-5' exonuclease/DNA polymerase [Mycetocola tolaasinivorans]RLP76357.1 bifunctional 3'-5' exonuclease/DNA polymerase [Mycetocola tolaasinivorans]
MPLVLSGSPHGLVVITPVEEDGTPSAAARELRGTAEILATISALEAEHPRWVWSDAGSWYPWLLEHGIRIERCTDLRLGHAVLRLSTTLAPGAFPSDPQSPWRHEPALGGIPEAGPTLFDEVDRVDTVAATEVIAEFTRQRAAVAAVATDNPVGAGKLRLLLAAESSGALVAAEIHHFGLPWSREEHNRILTEALGERPRFGGRPAILAELATEIQGLLNAPDLNPDSPPELLRALARAGISVPSTSKWVLREIEHPVIEPLLRFKSLSRLQSANGWVWLDTWVPEDRYRPEYVVGGTATGRWATNGGGAMQLPAQIRAAVRADPGHVLVVADAAQLEPRIIAAMSRDTAMAAAGAGKDLYQGLADAGVVPGRKEAKLAMLGALYGATSGESGALMPRLKRAFPQAIALVEHAAREGEKGRSVSTWLGRSSPVPDAGWFEFQRAAGQVDATDAMRRRAGTVARDWGRFSRNFIAQGTAAEWALCWLAGLRQRLAPLGTPGDRPHLVYFLHDEVVVHAPAADAEATAAAIRDAAAEAGRLLFGTFPVDFPLSVAIVDRYSEAK